jgi:hypothetical protein
VLRVNGVERKDKNFLFKLTQNMLFVR